jgi:peptidoglycan/LPS O-acetylase OafA/YrhL
VWHWFFFQVIQAGMKGQSRIKLIVTEFVVAFAVSLPVYYGVERRVLKIKLRFSSEREVVDLNTGKMVTIESVDADRSDPSRPDGPAPAP